MTGGDLRQEFRCRAVLSRNEAQPVCLRFLWPPEGYGRSPATVHSASPGGLRTGLLSGGQ